MGPSNVVAGQIFIAHSSAYTLIDTRASHLFVFASFIKKLDMVPEFLDDVWNISFPLREKLTL